MAGTAGSAKEPPQGACRACRSVAEPEMVIVHVPIAFRRRCGRKALLTPTGDSFAPSAASHTIEEPAIIKALARAFRWRKLIESGLQTTVRDIAIAEKINPSYVSRILRFTALSPELVEAIVECPASFALDRAMKRLPVEWESQRVTLQLTAPAFCP